MTSPPGPDPRIDGSGTGRARCLLAPNPSPMTLDGTNTWLIAEPGSATAIVVDPGPDDEGHLTRVHGAATAAGQRISQIVLTHGHLDHSEGARRLAGLTGAPVLALDPAQRLGDGGLAPGDVLTSAGCEVRVIGTPGHTADSACLLIEADRAVLTGDTVLGRGTTVVAHPDGRLVDYLGSLRRLHDLGTRAVLPGHGPELPDLAAITDAYLAHREERLEQIRAALDELGPDAAAMDVVRVVYADVDPVLWPAAELSVRAQLEYLRR